MSETALAFLLLYGAGLIAALALRPIYGLYTYIGVFYVHPPSRWWGATLPDLRWSLVAAVITLLALYLHRSTFRPRPPWYSSAIIRIFILYVIWMWLQWPWAPSSSHGNGVILFTKYVLLIYLIYTTIDNERDFYGICFIHVLGCAFFGWLVYMAPDAGRLEGVGGPGVDNANTLGMHLATGLIFASFMLLASKGWARWIIFATIPFILNGIIQTETRGAIVGLLLGSLATVYLKPKEYRRLYYILAILGFFAFLAVANESFTARMETITAATSEEAEWDSSAISRIAIIEAQVEMFADHPMGVGHQGTAYLSRQYLDERWLAGDSGDRASHNTVMSILVDQGLPGILLFIALAFVVCKILRRLKRMDSIGLNGRLGLYRTMVGGSLVTIIGAGMFAQYLKAEVLIWNLVLLAVLWDLARVAAEDQVAEETRSAALPRGNGRTLVPARRKSGR